MTETWKSNVNTNTNFNNSNSLRNAGGESDRQAQKPLMNYISFDPNSNSYVYSLDFKCSTCDFSTNNSITLATHICPANFQEEVPFPMPLTPDGYIGNGVDPFRDIPQANQTYPGMYNHQDCKPPIIQVSVSDILSGNNWNGHADTDPQPQGTVNQEEDLESSNWNSNWNEEVIPEEQAEDDMIEIQDTSSPDVEEEIDEPEVQNANKTQSKSQMGVEGAHWIPPAGQSIFQRVAGVPELRMCKICGKMVKGRKHSFVHRPGTYACSYCPCVYTRSDNLAAHVKKKH